MSSSRLALCGSSVLCVAVVGLLLAAPPEDIAKPRTIVGELVSVAADHVVVSTTGEAEDAEQPREVDVRVPIRPETTVKLNDEPVALTELRRGDALKITPFPDAPGVAMSISAARVGGKVDDEDIAQENRAAQAAEQGARLEANEDQRDAESAAVGRNRWLVQGRIFRVHLPGASAASRAGLRPGDVLVFTRTGGTDLDPAILRGLRVERIDTEGGVIIEHVPAEVEEDDDVRIRIEDDEDGVREKKDVEVEIDRD